MIQYHVAQLNIARILYPVDDHRMHGFMSALDEINALAESSKGFIWRLIGEGNDATSLRPFPDDNVLVNMSVWESVEALHAYTYRSAHAGFLKDRTKWFEMPSEPHSVLWWIEAGLIPSVEEAKERLTHLNQYGPTPYAFTFKQRFAHE